MELYRTIRFLESRPLFFARKQVLKISDSEKQDFAGFEISNSRRAARGL